MEEEKDFQFTFKENREVGMTKDFRIKTRTPKEAIEAFESVHPNGILVAMWNNLEM